MTESTPLTFIPAVSAEDRRARITLQLTIATAAISAVVSFAFLFASFGNPIWQLTALSGAFSISWICSGIAATSKQFEEPSKMISLSAAGLLGALFFLCSTVSSVGILIAVIILLYTVIITTSCLTPRQGDAGLSLGLLAAVLAALSSSLNIFQHISLPILLVYLPAVLGILVMVNIVLVTMNFIVATLRIKFIMVSLAIAIIPLVLLSLIESRFVQTAVQNQTNQALHLAAEQTANRLDEFLQTNQLSVSREAELPVFVNYLLMDPNARKSSQQESDLEAVVDSLKTKQKDYLYSYGLINMAGENVYDTNPNEIGKNERGKTYYAETVSTGQPQTSPIEFNQQNGDAFVYFSAPVRNDNQEIVGVLRLKYHALIFQYLLEEYSHLIGSRSYPVLFNENYIRIADLLTPNLLYKGVAPVSEGRYSDMLIRGQIPNLPANQLFISHPEYEAALRNYQLTPDFSIEAHPGEEAHLESATIVKLANQDWYVVFLQEQTALTRLLNNQNQLSTLIATIIAGVIGLLATIFSRVLSNPLIELQGTAQKISGGDLEAQAVVSANDEIGTLAQAFNTMTAQLRGFITSLEDRVRERTQELAHQNEALQHRSNQLRTVADVARDVASAKELETLLANVTRMISERFGYYHVGIFLIDERSENAILRAANSEGGQRMLARQHTLKVGQVGIVGYVTGTGEPRIATDVGQDAVFFNNPDLPHTRSEMALPLKTADRIIGALDVQSTESDAFSQEDIDLFSTLADQVSIAIQNSRLLAETMQALEEAQQMHRRYLQQQWTQEIDERDLPAYLFNARGLTALPPSQSPVLDHVLQNQQAVVRSEFDPQTQQEETSAAVPIVLRGETIGVIQVQQKASEGRQLNQEEIQMVQSVADQVALALENARLFEQTTRRAERERRVFEITSKIRATNDPQRMLQVALEELQQTLKASRAQIILNTSQAEGPNGSNGGNGSNGHQPVNEEKSGF